MKSPAAERRTAEPIAVIGLAGRFPGARNVAAFWENLRQGVESISTLTDEQLQAAGIPRELCDNPAYVRRRALLDDVQMFDAAFFGYTPGEAARMDPQQRIFLETAWEALEHAGYDTERHPGAIGVFAGCHQTSYLLANLCSSREFIEEFLGTRPANLLPTFLGNEKDFLTSRVAYKLNLRGPAITVQTACSTSLVAIVMACDSLRAGQSDLALAGGVAVLLPEHKGHLHQEGGILSPDGHCRAFDAAAQGTVFGSGAGVVVLKRLSAALADGDTIHAVIRGAALNNDGGLKASYTAPAVEGQAAVIRAAQEQGGIAPDTIGYVEAHGTATALGDPIEIAALTQAFRRSTDRRQFCALGSVKTNVGHLDAAAGVVGFIKAVLTLREKQIPPSLHFQQPNPRIDFAATPFKVVTALTPWEANGTPRRAAVSAFGVGGTNAHVVLEEAPPQETGATLRGVQLLVLSARTPAVLEQASAQLARHLQSVPPSRFADTAFTLQLGRRELAHRRALVCRNPEEAVALLEKPDARRVFTQHCEARDTPVVFLFPGQGAQFAGMGESLYQDEPVFREAVAVCAGLLHEHLELDVTRLICPTAAERTWAAEKLTQTQFAQPALFTFEYALARLWLSWGIQPAAMIGHSLGEYVAACLAGVFSLGRALEIVAERAMLIEARPPGAMLAVRLPERELVPLLGDGIDLAAVNSATLAVASGPLDEIARLENDLRARGVATIRLNASHAFHSASMDAVVGPLARRLRRRTLAAPTIPCVSSITGKWLTDAEATDPEYWATHARRTVRFADALGEVLQEPRILLEVGPGATLTTLARQHPAKTDEHVIITSLPSAREPEQIAMLNALGRLWLAGVRPDWNGFHARENRRRVPLPAYPFERKRHWIDFVRSEFSPPTALPTPVPPSVPAPVTPAVASESFATVEPPSTPMIASSHRPRADRLIAQLKDLFHELSGVEFGPQEIERPFVELGLDSLFLTQARQEVQTQFGVRLTYRQLQEEAVSLRGLAEMIDRTLPPDAPAPTVTTTIEVEKIPAVSPAPPAAAPGKMDWSALAELMRQQLALIQAMCSQPSAEAAPPVIAVPPAPATLPVVAPKIVVATTCPQNDGQLSPAQQRHLAELTERLQRLTPRSKQLAEEWRTLVSDPRSTVNFRPAWKELTYQLVVERSAGARVWDVDGNEFIDLTMGFGVHFLGHSPAFVRDALTAQLQLGMPLGPQLPLVGEVATLLKEFTGMDRVAFNNSGSEAISTAVRIARAATGRDKIAYFTGSYHGVFDEVLLRAHDAESSRPIAAGIPRSVGENVVVLDYARPASLDALRQLAPRLAAVLVEPVQNRQPELDVAAFLRELRDITTQSGTFLIFDEAITGFRLHPGGAQALFDVRADLAVYGKVLGCGLPFAVLAGRGNSLDAIDGGDWRFGDDSQPEADVTFATATFVRNPLALAAARATLLHLRDAGPDLQAGLNQRTDALVADLNEFLHAAGAGIHVVNFGSLFRIQFAPEMTCHPLLTFNLLTRGIYFRDASQSGFLSTAHTPEDIRAFADAFKESVTAMQEAEFLPGHPVRASAPRAVEPPVIAPDMPVAMESLIPADATEYPLTPAQREVWLACQFSAEASCAFNEALTLHLRGQLQVEQLVEAIQDVVAQHEALRATISPDGGMQSIQPVLRIPVPRTDWSHLGEEERAAHLGAFTAQNMEEPFDLAAGPLLRVRLLKLADEHHLLFVTAHHLVCDGETGGILLREIGRHYSLRVEGKTDAGKPPVQFRELVALQSHQQEEGASERYWLAEFAERPVPLALPLSHPRSGTGLHQGGVLRAEIDGNLLRGLKRLGANHGGSLFTVVLAAFKTWLLRLAGAEETVVGVFNSARTVTGRTGVVGHAVTTLPLRTRTALGVTFVEFLAQVGRRVLDAREHADFTYGDLVQRLQLPREPGRAPLIDAVFNHDRHGDIGEGFHGLATEVEPIAHAFVHFDLFLNVREFNDRAMLELEYRADLFDTEVMTQWFGHLQTVLHAVAAAPELRLAEIPLLSPTERHRVVAEWNQTALDYPRNACLHELFEAQVEATPEAVAVVSGPDRLTYREINRYANRIANHLRTHGVGRETLVGICLERSWRMVAAVLGVLKSGGAYVPLDPTHPAERIEFIRQDARLRAILTEEAVSARLPGSADAENADEDSARVICLDQHARDIARESAEDPGSASEPGNLAYVLYTSGSTGRPKGVAIEHRNVVSFVHWAGTAFSRRELGGVLAATTLNFDLSVFELFAPLCQGGKVIIVPNVLALADLPDAGEVQLINTVPSAMTELLRLGAVPESVETVNLAGEAVSAELVEQLYELAHIKRVNDLYGPTEATVYATHAVREAGAPPTIGRPIANLQAFILDARFAPVPVGVPAELFLGGEGLARGYLHQPGLTAEKFIRHPFSTNPSARLYRTGDLCRYRIDGSIEFVGRIDHQLKVRGYRIEPGEIEVALNGHASVDESVVVAREDKPGDRRLVGYFVSKVPGTTEAGLELAAVLREHLMEKVPPYLVPDALVPLAAMPRTPAGKLDRAALPAPGELAAATTTYVEPTREIEKSICALWSDLLGVERIGLLDNFFELGGHSLLATRVVLRLRDEFELELPISAIFNAPTVGGLAREIQNRLGDSRHGYEWEDRLVAAE